MARTSRRRLKRIISFDATSRTWHRECLGARNGNRNSKVLTISDSDLRRLEEVVYGRWILRAGHSRRTLSSMYTSRHNFRLHFYNLLFNFVKTVAT